jgi:hypothetical protein
MALPQRAAATTKADGARAMDLMVDYHLKGPAWLTCLKLDANGRSQHYAIFIQGDKIVDSRAGILMDRCHKEIYSSFDFAREAAPFNLAPEAKNSKATAAVPVR